MKTTSNHYKSLLLAFTPLVITSIANVSIAQESILDKNPEVEEITPDNSELLKKGNTWTYAVSVQIPNNVKFDSTLTDQGEKTKSGMIYRFEEIQQSTGLKEIEALERKAPQINIFIEGKLTKKQILEYKDGSLLYYGTYHHDPDKPDLKKGMISINPILLYIEDSKIAQKWSWSATGLPLFQFRVAAKEVELNVKGTNYIVDKIQMDQIQQGTKNILQTKEIWFAKNIGIVKEREKSYIGDGKAIIKTLELTSFANSPQIHKTK